MPDQRLARLLSGAPGGGGEGGRERESCVVCRVMLTKRAGCSCSAKDATLCCLLPYGVISLLQMKVYSSSF